jgi:hypothetical protein
MTLTITTHSTTQARHWGNMMASLQRRLAAAQAQQDSNLVTLLEQEYQQLTTVQTPTVRRPWQAFKNAMKHAIANWSQLRVKQVVDPDGQVWWWGYNPKTGQTRYVESEAELRAWIEDTYWE